LSSRSQANFAGSLCRWIKS